MTLVPVRHQRRRPDSAASRPANKDQFLTDDDEDASAGVLRRHGRRRAHEPRGPALQSGNGNNAWNTILSEIDARRTADGSSRYYMGIVNPAYSTGVAGIGYVGYPVALAWDKLPSGASVAAHEWGHNWGRKHAPCGNPGGRTAAIPTAAASSACTASTWRPRRSSRTTSHDLMGYCSDEWISDYTYRGVMQFRGAEAGISTALGQAVQPTLVVWGRIEGGEVVLEPAFQAVTRPSLPAAGGPYELEARAARRIAGVRAPSSRRARWRTIRARLGTSPSPCRSRPSVPGGSRRSGSTAQAGRAAVRGRRRAAAPRSTCGRVAPGRVALRWDASRTPMVVVRDPRTGQILSFARGGRAEVADRRVRAGRSRRPTGCGARGA